VVGGLRAPVTGPPDQRSVLFKYVALYGAYVVALHVVPGPWKNWKKGREGKALDPWTLQHVLWGALGQRMGLTATEVLYLGTVNEIAEAGIRTLRPDLLWGTPESPSNVLADLVATWAGWGLGKLLAGPVAPPGPRS